MAYFVGFRFSWASRQEVVVGLHSQSSPEGSQRIAVVDIIPHEHYGENGGYDNDIMLLKLESPVEFSDSVSTVCLAEEGVEINDGRRCYTTGWGHTACEPIIVSIYFFICHDASGVSHG